MDLVLIVDQSVSASNWDTMKSFIISFLSKIEIGTSTARIGLVTFADSAQSEFFLNTHSSRDDVIQGVLGIFSSSETGNNAQAASTLAQTEQFITTNGDRNSAKNIILYLTDSESDISEATLTAAQLLKGNDVAIFSVGIANLVNSAEIKDISSEPQIENANYWTTSSFQSLAGITGDLLRQMEIITTRFNTIGKLGGVCIYVYIV